MTGPVNKARIRRDFIADLLGFTHIVEGILFALHTLVLAPLSIYLKAEIGQHKEERDVEVMLNGIHWPTLSVVPA